MKYNTKQRELILKYLCEKEGEHVKAEDILEYLKNNDTPVGKSTVYRYLEALVEQNLVRKYTIEEGKGACYQFIGNDDTHHCKEHYHLKCSDCGELFHVSCEFMDEINEHILNEHNFVIDKSKTVFYGTCEKCRKKKECNNEENNNQQDEKSNEKCCSRCSAKHENET